MEEIKEKFELQKQNVLSQIDYLNSNAGTSDTVKKLASLSKLLTSLDSDLKKELKKNASTHLCWPHSTANGNPRTVENVIEIVNLIENSDHPLERDITKGITGRSLLLNLENFDYVNNVPTEYMHCVCLGVVRRMVELTFKVGQIRPRNTKRKLSDPSKFNRLMILVQVPFEFSRRCRNLDFAVLKATEFRNIIMFFFILVLECIDKEFVVERRLWLQLAFTIRACVLTNEEFHYINENTVSAMSLSFYKNYEKTYGSSNCTYSTHIVGSHIVQIRGNEPLTSRSAFPYESFYAEMKNLFCPGTLSPLKQILRNCFIKRQLQPHQCFNHIKYSKMRDLDNMNIGKENNHSIYVLSENEHCMYNIIGVNEDNTFTCTKQGKFPAKFPELKNVNWSKVGVYRLGPTCDKPVKIQKKLIAGKVIHVNNYLITCPNHVLREK